MTLDTHPPEDFMVTTSARRPIRSAALAVLAVGMSGCGWGGGDVTGTVRFNGTPVTSGWVTVNYPNGEHSPLSGIIHPDGTYRVPGCPSGAARITVRPADGGLPGKKVAGQKAPMVPARYADAEKSDLRLKATGRPQTFDIDLKP